MVVGFFRGEGFKTIRENMVKGHQCRYLSLLFLLGGGGGGGGWANFTSTDDYFRYFYEPVA